MHNHVCNELNGDAPSFGNVHVSPTFIYGLEVVHDQLLLELDHHVALEDDPERFILDHGVAEGTESRVHGIVVGGVGDDVEVAVVVPDGVVAEPNAAIGEKLAVEVPRWVALPAVVDGVADGTGEEAQFAMVLCAVLYTPAQLRQNSLEI
ncbi:hypothetical protein Vadar_013431 [Vaccinium darrowii]|uniref:Uncharacterized protein n=1 Tax=Vaccinium darrowii TaxID=229202 RepID=A0ACB7X0T2_9ERIC|nr:hypothetical protein Vadar_013431 [Vaccinium darrowii]